MANGRRGGQRMDKEWSSIPSTNSVIVASSTVLQGAVTLGTSGTVIRMIGEYTIVPTSAPAASDAVLIGVGIGVVSSDAFTAGAASVPDPSGDPEYPWLYWASHPIVFSGTGTTGAAIAFRHRFDVRSMRKMKPKESLAMIIQYVDIAGTPPITFLNGLVRVLIAGI